MLEFDTGKAKLRTFFGARYCDMLTHALNKKFYVNHLASYVDMEPFGAPGVISWFVFMNGQPHGYPDDWLWTNEISDDGNEIIEENICDDLTKLLNKRIEEGFLPFRLAFRRDPFDCGNANWCQFVGAFRFGGFIDGLSRVKYVKVADRIVLPGIGARAQDDCRDIFINDWSEYRYPVEKMGLNGTDLQTLRQANIKYAGELLSRFPKGSVSACVRIMKALYEVYRSR